MTKKEIETALELATTEQLGRALAKRNENPGRKAEVHEEGCSKEYPCMYCRRRNYRKRRYAETGKR
jgi:hypothetical protein